MVLWNDNKYRLPIYSADGFLLYRELPKVIQRSVFSLKNSTIYDAVYVHSLLYNEVTRQDNASQGQWESELSNVSITPVTPKKLQVVNEGLRHKTYRKIRNLLPSRGKFRVFFKYSTLMVALHSRSQREVIHYSQNRPGDQQHIRHHDI